MRLTFTITVAWILTMLTILCGATQAKQDPSTMEVLLIFLVSYFYTHYFSSKAFPKRQSMSCKV
jgi:hypothetical protein